MRREIRVGALPASPKAEAKRRFKASPVVSSVALTPGTEFMHDVCVSLGFFVASRAHAVKWREVRGCNAWRELRECVGAACRS